MADDRPPDLGPDEAEARQRSGGSPDPVEPEVPEAGDGAAATGRAPDGAAATEQAPTAFDDGVDDTARRPMDARLARVHLRTGSYGLARAELESMAGAGTLDGEALADLAEVRWRTGDLPGAGEAAQAYLATGREAATPLAIAAEAAAALGRPGEARRLATRALAAADGPIDGLFLGIARSPIWPTDARLGEPAAELFPIGEPASRGGATSATAAITTRRVRRAAGAVPAPQDGPQVHAALPWATAAAVAGSSEPSRPILDAAADGPTDGQPPGAAGAGFGLEAGLWDEHEVPVLGESLPDPSVELDAARAAIAGEDHDRAALHLALALRLDPTMAPAVLEAAGHHRSPALDMVRGDALRLVGHEAEARRAYFAAARGAADHAEQGDP